MGNLGASTRTAAALAAALALALSACGDGGSDPDRSTLNLELTDAPPGDATSIFIVLGDFGLVDAGGDFALLHRGPSDFIDLTVLAGGTKQMAEDIFVPSETYDRALLEMGPVVVQTDEGEVFSRMGGADSLGLNKTGDIQCPVCTAKGIEVEVPGGSFELTGGTQTLVMDFDARRSVRRKAGNDTLVLDPAVTLSQKGKSGTIQGTVTAGTTIPDCGGAARSVSAFFPVAVSAATGDTAKSGIVGSGGAYEMRFVQAGDYGMGHEERVTFGTAEDSVETLVFTADASPAQATVQAGGSTTVDYTITDATCQ